MTPNIQIARKAILPTSTQMKTKKRAKPKPSTNTTKSTTTNQQTNVVNDIDKENEKVYDPNSMDHELDSAIALMTSFIQNSKVAKQSLEYKDFVTKLLADLKAEYTGHWYPERPLKGSAFRCLRINQNDNVSLIENAARLTGVLWVISCLPKELTIWIDPGEVSYRIGEEGSICVHFSRKLNSNNNNNNIRR